MRTFHQWLLESDILDSLDKISGTKSPQQELRWIFLSMTIYVLTPDSCRPIDGIEAGCDENNNLLAVRVGKDASPFSQQMAPYIDQLSDQIVNVIETSGDNLAILLSPLRLVRFKSVMNGGKVVDIKCSDPQAAPLVKKWRGRMMGLANNPAPW